MDLRIMNEYLDRQYEESIRIQQEHDDFEFEYKSLYKQEKQRADELEEKLNKEVEESYQMENRWRTEIERADAAENKLDDLEVFIPSLRAAVESTLNYSHPNVDPDLQSDIGAYSSLMQQILENLERG